AFVPPIKGSEMQGVFVYRTIEDLEAIIEYGKSSKKAAVLGGGLLGLEAAKAMLDLNQETHVIEFASRLMPRQLDQGGSDALKAKMEDLGVNIHMNRNTASILGEDKMTGLEFTDGQLLAADMLVISCGIKPRDELATQCGLEVGQRGGIVVNDLLETTDKDIYAIGECALHKNFIYGLVAPGYEMADVVVDQLLQGEEKVFESYDMSTKLKLIGVDVASFGDALCENVPHKPIVFEDNLEGIYKRINISEDGKKLLGGILVGDAEAYGMLLQVTLNGMALPPNPEDLILGSRGGESTEMELPDTAQICSCENVTKGDICKAVVDQNLENIADVKACTKAGTGCGACTPMVTDIFNDQLKSMGKTVKKVLCEHFEYSRQELFDLIKVKGIKSYDDLLDAHGSGDGCEVCKPAVASLMASIWNELILNQDTIQDTNDRFLANIQKGGSYSVVPRIPGGEITPDKLIVIGQVAKKYDLYTKITGGQRIDLFGASVNQLPDIWEELIDAGFESGHAYGKSLRTVKSCVGSSWCRYGLHDSVSFAIEVEERYRGLRSPHKLKSAVSGCRRECAEALSKDFGIIATEVGWNLYVCGNGGSNPQHALLLAGDIDSETCLKYIDRFLMFYIKTAEPLNRTATWLNKLEGGIEYLKQVVVEDSLGIGADLEGEMDFMVDTYKCEWKEVVNNPELRKKFTHFVNADIPDPTMKFEDFRGQKKPVDWDKELVESK
ncbi:MAG: nitrite reductase large subunit NirB, partial [Reichenbachiella sp.]